MGQIPLYGVSSSAVSQFAQLRVIFASNSGTLMQLGIGPIVTAGLILQLLAGSSIIQCDMSNAEDRGLFTSASKVFTVVLTGIQAAAYLISGMFGTITGAATLVIFLELIFAGIIVMLMDELVQKGDWQRNQLIYYGGRCPKRNMGHFFADHGPVRGFTFSLVGSWTDLFGLGIGHNNRSLSLLARVHFHYRYLFGGYLFTGNQN